MKKILPILSLTSVILLLNGCAIARYSQTNPDKTTASFSYTGFVTKGTLEGLNVNSSTKTTTTGLKVKTADISPDQQTIAILTEALLKLSAAAGQKMLVPVP